MRMSAIVIKVAVVMAAGLFWVIFASIRQNRLPNRTNYTPFDDMMSGRVGGDPLQPFLEQKDDEKDKS